MNKYAIFALFALLALGSCENIFMEAAKFMTNAKELASSITSKTPSIVPKKSDLSCEYKEILDHLVSGVLSHFGMHTRDLRVCFKGSEKKWVHFFEDTLLFASKIHRHDHVETFFNHIGYFISSLPKDQLKCFEKSQDLSGILHSLGIHEWEVEDIHKKVKGTVHRYISIFRHVMMIPEGAWFLHMYHKTGCLLSYIFEWLIRH